MKSWQSRTTHYFYLIAALVVLATIMLISIDSYKSRQVKHSLVSYMDNLRDLIFMSTYDALRKGNMKNFTNHLKEIGTYDDVREFSLLNARGEVRYSSDPAFVGRVDLAVRGLESQLTLDNDGFTTYYFPVETTSYCTRCHPGWQAGAINSYYKLDLSRQALDAMETGTFYYHGFKLVGSGIFIACTYLLFTLYERKRHEQQVLLSASVFENAVEAISITDVKGLVERINPAFTQMTGFAPENILGKSIFTIDAGEINAATHAAMRRSLRVHGLWTGELWNRRKNGESFPVRLSVTAVRDDKQRLTHFVSIFYDITDMKANQEHLTHQVYHDALTGLPNRRLFSDRLKMALNTANRHRHTVVVLFIDLDNFKVINDSAGHHIGDLLLVEIAERLQNCMRECDTISRFGGDEFVIILPEIMRDEEVQLIVRRLQEEIARPLTLKGHHLTTSPSIGVACYPQDGEEIEDLIIKADRAMYQAKKRGKNLCVRYAELAAADRSPNDSGAAVDTSA